MRACCGQLSGGSAAVSGLKAVAVRQRRGADDGKIAVSIRLLDFRPPAHVALSPFLFAHRQMLIHNMRDITIISGGYSCCWKKCTGGMPVRAAFLAPLLHNYVGLPTPNAEGKFEDGVKFRQNMLRAANSAQCRQKRLLWLRRMSSRAAGGAAKGWRRAQSTCRGASSHQIARYTAQVRYRLPR